jgi:hypothetical protein
MISVPPLPSTPEVAALPPPPPVQDKPPDVVMASQTVVARETSHGSLTWRTVIIVAVIITGLCLGGILWWSLWS